MEIGIDVIGDLFLSPDDEFNWDGKPTSLYCIVTGNVSNDIDKLEEVLNTLSENYKGIFYVTGSYEFDKCDNIPDRIVEINLLCRSITNVASLWHHVVIIENIAILGCNGWLDHWSPESINLYGDDLVYLKNSIVKLQKHGDVKSIITISNSVPNKSLYYGEIPENVQHLNNLDYILKYDTEQKVKSWVFGNYQKHVDTTIGHVRYLNNPYVKNMPYWPKRLNAEI